MSITRLFPSPSYGHLLVQAQVVEEVNELCSKAQVRAEARRRSIQGNRRCGWQTMPGGHRAKGALASCDSPASGGSGAGMYPFGW